MQLLNVIGGGLAGCEAVWQAHQQRPDLAIRLWEMRPQKMTGAHKTGNLAELVCSNSFKSLDPLSASGLLKSEMERFDSLILQAAMYAKVPAGNCLAVDREKLSDYVQKHLQSIDCLERIDAELCHIPKEAELRQKNEAYLIATGPLTSQPLFESLTQVCGDENLYFYDAIAPIIEMDSIDLEACYFKSRYDKGSPDYLNIPLDKEQYEEFIRDLNGAEKVKPHAFEKEKYFEACLPIEVLAERGADTLRFGPMKPVGLEEPKSGRRPYAVIQLRKENKDGSMVSMVGFQSKMKWGEQKRIFAKLPGLEKANFLRFGSIHRNTYIHGPNSLNPDLSLKNNPRVFLAGQITGVEGYLESAAIGLLAGRFAASSHHDLTFRAPPASTVLGALHSYVTESVSKAYSPMNTNHGLLPSISKKIERNKVKRKEMQSRAAMDAFQQYVKENPAPGMLH